ncbi:hypothetical protein O0L34_g10508 [Tuta absoluta]|nr:hypothetical protein O0L34_g10508 [Tuta absoluta]
MVDDTNQAQVDEPSQEKSKHQEPSLISILNQQRDPQDEAQSQNLQENTQDLKISALPENANQAQNNGSQNQSVQRSQNNIEQNFNTQAYSTPVPENQAQYFKNTAQDQNLGANPNQARNQENQAQYYKNPVLNQDKSAPAKSLNLNYNPVQDQAQKFKNPALNQDQSHDRANPNPAINREYQALTNQYINNPTQDQDNSASSKIFKFNANPASYQENLAQNLKTPALNQDQKYGTTPNPALNQENQAQKNENPGPNVNQNLSQTGQLRNQNQSFKQPQLENRRNMGHLYKRFEIMQRADETEYPPKQILRTPRYQSNEETDNSAMDAIERIGRMIKEFTKTKKLPSEVVYRAQQDFDIKPSIVKFRSSDQPSLKLDLTTNTISRLLESFLSSPTARRYADSIGKQAAEVFRSLSEAGMVPNDESRPEV